MSLYFASLNSGSNGNSYYIANEDEAVLVDVGLSCRELEKRLVRLRLSADKVKAIFISHEHSDHIRGLEVFAKKYQLPVYITEATLKSGKINLHPDLVLQIKAYQDIYVGKLCITPFPKCHDAADPHSFNISYQGLCIGVFTDIGRACEHVIKNFQLCDAVFLEANYDEDMLERGRYPYHLKRRIRGGHGHLSNREALDVFNQYRSPKLSHLILSHLSRDNNNPDLVREIFAHHAGNTHVDVASRYQESMIYKIGSDYEISVRSTPPIDSQTVQYSLF